MTSPIWSDPTYNALREALKRPLVNLELKILSDVNFLTVNIGSYAAERGVANNESLDGVMHVTPMVPGTPLHSTVANMPYCLIVMEVLKGHMEGIHSVVIRNLVSGTFVPIVGDNSDVTLLVDGLRKMHENEGLRTIRIAYFILGSLTQQYTKGYTELWIITIRKTAATVAYDTVDPCKQGTRQQPVAHMRVPRTLSSAVGDRHAIWQPI